jgi:hypothetical protein
MKAEDEKEGAREVVGSFDASESAIDKKFLQRHDSIHAPIRQVCIVQKYSE